MDQIFILISMNSTVPVHVPRPFFCWSAACDIQTRKKVCFTQVHVYFQTAFIFGCQLEKVSSHTFNVQHNESVDIRAEYVSSSTSGTFYFCI